MRRRPLWRLPARKTAVAATAKKQEECDELKKMIGFPERSTEEIKKQFAEDMATYGNARRSEADPNAGAAVFDATPSTTAACWRACTRRFRIVPRS